MNVLYSFRIFGMSKLMENWGHRSSCGNSRIFFESDCGSMYTSSHDVKKIPSMRFSWRPQLEKDPDSGCWVNRSVNSSVSQIDDSHPEFSSQSLHFCYYHTIPCHWCTHWVDPLHLESYMVHDILHSISTLHPWHYPQPEVVSICNHAVRSL